MVNSFKCLDKFNAWEGGCKIPHVLVTTVPHGFELFRQILRPIFRESHLSSFKCAGRDSNTWRANYILSFSKITGKHFKRLPKWISAPSFIVQQWDRVEKEEGAGTEENQSTEKCKWVLSFYPKCAGRTQAAKTKARYKFYSPWHREIGMEIM